MAVVHILLSLAPVLLFLAALHVLDSYQLVAPRLLAGAILSGMAAAGLAYVVNRYVLTSFAVDVGLLTGWIAPVVEEVLKGILVAILVLRHRVGFLVDAAILGFAVGAGFAFVENIYYLNALPNATIWTWIIRGFGTAIMHGGATTILALVTKVLADRAATPGPWLVLPGLVAACLLHGAFNQFAPIPMTALVLVVLPALVGVVFAASERATRNWITEGFDADQELLGLMSKGDMADSRIGRYLAEIRSRFPGEVIVDMFCLLRLEMELSIRAKGVLMMREAGFEPKPDPGVRAKLAEIDHLKQAIGTVGMLAIDPFLRTRGRERWQMTQLHAG